MGGVLLELETGHVCEAFHRAIVPRGGLGLMGVGRTMKLLELLV